MSRKSSIKLRLDFTAKSSIKPVQELKSSEIDLSSIISELRINGALHIDRMRQIITSSCRALENLSNLIEIQSPVMVVGDVHGQFFDLLNIFEQFGKIEDTSYLFMGDYVDRGQFCIEVLTLLLCMKIKYPRRMHLLRGNHQSRVLTSTFNFREECLRKYDQDIYGGFVELFDLLPLGAIVDGKYFCVHAGISPDFKTLQEIQKVNRFKEPPEKGGVCDLLWSDPVEQILQKWTPNKNRMCSYYYGITQSRTFLENNKLKLIIRGHEVENSGFKYQKHSNGKPLTLTIFSAPNYCDSYRNKGSVLYIARQKLNIFSFSEVQHPLVLPNYMNIIEWSIPFLAQEVTKLFKRLLKLQKTKQKKIKSDKILNNQNVFKTQVLALARLELIERVISQKKLKNQEQILRQNLKAICQFSTTEFVKLKEEDLGQKYPSETNYVIGPKLHSSFKKLVSLNSIEGEQDSINEDLQCNQDQEPIFLSSGQNNNNKMTASKDFKL